MNRIAQKQKKPRGIYWWVTGRIEGQVRLLGPYDTEETADDMGFSAFKNSPYDKHMLNTCNRHEAASRLKHIMFEKTGDLPESMKPVRHGLPGG